MTPFQLLLISMFLYTISYNFDKMEKYPLIGSIFALTYFASFIGIIVSFIWGVIYYINI